MFSSRSLNFLVIFVVLVFNGSQACFRSNEHQSSSITTNISFYKECQCTEPGYTINNLRWLDNDDQPIEPLGPGTSSNVYVEEQSDRINLHISSITKAMSGTYKCVTEVDGIQYSQSYTIKAYEPLTFYQTPKDQYLVKGFNSPIKCQPKSDTTVIVSWQKEQDIEIPNDSDKYNFENDGLIINNVTTDDAGVYKCTARVIATNEEVDKYIKVEVRTMPQVKNLMAYPGTTVVAGDNLSIECIADGMPHPKYVWNKTSEADAQESSNVTWHQEENTIVFYSIKPEDRGLYACYAFNSAGFHAMDVFVEVLIPPVITNFPNITDVEGATIQLICNATGKPDPTIFITYSGRGLNSDLDLIEYESMPNMPLINLNLSQEGIYLCNATNDVDSVTETMYLTVLHRPYFEKQEERVWGWDGKTINLSCVQDSNPPADVSWRFQGNDILTEQEVKINKKLLSVLNKMPEPYFTFTIDNETAYGIYECTATNIYGEATKRIRLQEGFRPVAVNNVSIEDLTATSITFIISGPDHVNGPPLLGYTATYDEAENYNITDIHINRTWAVGRPFKLDKLKPNTTYYVQLAAVNEVGTGDWSEFIEFSTMDKSVPEAPEWREDPIILASNSHVLKWKAPYDNGEPIDYYTLRYCSEKDEELCKTQRISPSTELELVDLEFNTTYFLELVAHNAEGDSMAANISVIVPAPHMDSPTTLLSIGAMIGISIVIVVLCLLLLDVLLLVWRRQGIIATCCYKKDSKRKENAINFRDKKVLLANGEPVEEVQPNTQPTNGNGHKEFQYNKNTGVVTGKHSAV